MYRYLIFTVVSDVNKYSLKNVAIKILKNCPCTKSVNRALRIHELS